MRRKSTFQAFLAACSLLAFAAFFSPVQAETVTMNLALSPANEAPPITNLNATGNFQLTLEVTRDAAGTITGGKVTVVGVVNFPGAITITGFHIHQAPSTATGSVIFDSGINNSNPLALATGVGPITSRELSSTDTAAVVARLTNLRNNPTGYYLNLHTAVNPSGAIRAQLTRWDELHANTVTLSPVQEVPPVTGLNASATATIIANPIRLPNGAIIGAYFTFNIAYDSFPANTTFTGLHVHEGAAGANGPVRFDARLLENPVVSATGKGTLNLTAFWRYNETGGGVNSAPNPALGRLLADASGFYVNLHTTAYPDGALRGQLTSMSNGAPALVQSNTYFLPAGNSSTTVTLLAAGADLMSIVLINGQQTTTQFDAATGLVNVTVPAALLTGPGVLQLQMRNSNGLLSGPLHLVVAAPTAFNNINPVAVDAASYRTALAPECIVAAFGTRLASRIAAPAPLASGIPVMPIALDGTSVYVNGVVAPLFYVSEGQINFEIPDGVLPGSGEFIVVAKDGVISRGQINVTNVAPAILTALSNGRGAPAAIGLATSTGTFYVVSNPDGTPREMTAGDILVLFGTGYRYRSNIGVATAGGVTATPIYVGLQGGLVGMDQINLPIPQAMAGKGELDLVFMIDGMQTNPVRIKIK